MNTSQPLQLSCEVRTTFGKKNRALRKSHFIPGVIYGEGQEPISITLPYRIFLDTFRKAGETTIVECQVGDQTIPTLISDVSVHSVKETILHVDFRRVNLKKKVETRVPVIVTGDSPAVKAGGVLLQQMQEVSVEAFPQNIPHDITINISQITEIGQEIKIADLPKSDTYLITDEPSRVLVSVVAHKEESVEAQTERAETEITTAKEPVEGEEGAESPEGATPAAGGRTEDASTEKPAKDKSAK